MISLTTEIAKYYWNKNIITHTLTSFGILDAILRPKEASQDIIRLDFEKKVANVLLNFQKYTSKNTS